ncbi:unnamed protein product [Rotaria magnacalcarata]|uniref:CCHC-type domain-containing protein n=1 Tax=Rotaria magnacalcarata TaxID=392030 RepID=A0A816ZT52_9BILA|nr:unnamed protein product [Rotaria magnacalcarata]CAF4340818.1 unnamed protein product [Rotaria magnacalcarata]
MAPPVDMDAATKAMFDILTQNMTQMRLANEAQAARMEKLTEELALSRDNKLRFKVIEPVKYSLDSTIKLQDYFVTFEIFCAAQYGNTNKDAWSAALGKFLEGDISQAYIGLEGGSMPWEDLKTTLAARFADTAQRTNKFLNLFNNLVQESNESLLNLSMKVERIAKQAYPTFNQLNLDVLIKNKFLAVVPTEVFDSLNIALLDRDLAAVPFEKIVSLAEKVQKTTPKTVIVEVAKAASTVVVESDPVANVQATISLRPNSGAVPRTHCTHCNKPGHAQTSCWTLHPNLKPARNSNGNFRGRGNFNNNNNRGSYSNNNRGGWSNNNGNQNNESGGGRKCYACNELGHMANMCPTRNRYNNMPPPSSFQIRAPNTTVFALDKHCGACGARGSDFHFFNSCPYVIEQQAQLASAAAANNTNPSNNPNTTPFSLNM